MHVDDMPIQHNLGPECEIALVARQVVDAGVCGQVLLHAHVVGEPLKADVALVGEFPHVRPYVTLQVVLMCERRPAQVTRPAECRLQ